MNLTNNVCTTTNTTNTILKAATTIMLMGIKRIAKEGITHPFGDERSVKQAFPAGINKKDADPFLMCDYFDTIESKGKAKHEDEFPIDWHPHRGFDIATYLRTGIGRHGDSLGNRETFETPGMQWMSTGSGVIHAEGGGNDKGQFVQGFQIWINVPSERKMDDPRYGTVPTKDLPLIVNDGITMRILAGDVPSTTTTNINERNESDNNNNNNNVITTGPFKTVQPVQMIDFELDANAKLIFDVAQGLNTVMVYIYEGSITKFNNNESKTEFTSGHVILCDADSNTNRRLELIASSDTGGAKVILFAGKKLKEPIAWHGPIVMNTQKQIQETFVELRSGQFPPKRVTWDYKRLASKR